MSNKTAMAQPTVKITTLVLVFLIAVIVYIKFSNNNSNIKYEPSSKEKIIITTTDEFMNYLFANNLDKAGDLSLGVVKFNIISNKLDIESDFSIDKVDTKLNFISDNLAIVNSTVEYIDNLKNEHDVVFYEIKLLKEEIWKIYHLEEKDPFLDYSKEDNQTTEKKEDEFKNIFSKYIEDLSEGEYEKSSENLIGRAKKMHNKANPALNELNLVSKVTDLESNTIYQEEKIAISRFNYINDNRPLSVLVYFYLTNQGWRIYNVNQV